MSAGNGTTTFANAAYTYDAMGRIATVGNSADTLTYSYVPGTGMIASSSWQTATVNTAYTYDSYKRLTNIAVNSANVYGYTLNDKNQRTGATLPDGRTWSYSYDTLGQLTGAVKRDSANTQLADLSYLYDQIGNRTSATENNTTTTYTSNLVNQYTQIASQVPTYDTDGNMTSYNGWTYTWNGENRLVAAENSDTRLEFSYDYMGRRLEKKVYSKGLLTLYDWSLEKHRKFVYDGYKLIAEFDALASDTQLASYLWQPETAGLDVPLMRIADNTRTYYIADGNKNIIALKDSSGADVSTYAYTPFGSLENPADGDENPFRFSSEYADDETGLVYYNYRYYSPQLGRWTKRDPIEERGSQNLYNIAHNNLVNTIDRLGLLEVPDEQVQETDKLILLKGIEAGAGVNEFTFRGKNLFRIGGTSYYVSTVPHPEVGMRVPKTGTTSVYFIWQKGNAKKIYRLDTAHTGANFNHHNRDGLYKLIPVQNHSPSPHATRYVTALRLFKIGGRFLFAVAIASDAYSIYQAQNRTREVVRTVAGWSGMLAGAWGGTKVGVAGGAYIGAHTGGIGVVPGTMTRAK